MKTVPLGEVCEIHVGRTPSRNEPRFWGQGEPWLSIADMNQGHLITQTREQITPTAARGGRQVSAGTVLLSFKLSIGKVSIAGLPLYTNEAIAALPIRDPKRLQDRYLLRALESMNLSADSNRAAMGATLNKAQLQKIEIPLPPVADQRRIAAILDQADALRAKRRQVLAQLDALVQSIFHEMFGGQDAAVELADVCVRITDGTHQPPDWAPTGIPFLFVSNISSGEILFDTQKYISEATWRELTRKTPIEVGDVLYSTVGSYGIPAVVRTPDRFSFQRHIAHIKPAPDRILPDFLAAQLKSPPLVHQAKKAARGIAQPTVNLADIRKFRITVPPLPAQKQFASIMENVMATRVQSREAAKSVDELFVSLQTRAFRGEL